jgi:hypothetical protein
MTIYNQPQQQPNTDMMIYNTPQPQQQSNSNGYMCPPPHQYFRPVNQFSGYDSGYNRYPEATPCGDRPWNTYHPAPTPTRTPTRTHAPNRSRFGNLVVLRTSRVIHEKEYRNEFIDQQFAVFDVNYTYRICARKICSRDSKGHTTNAQHSSFERVNIERLSQTLRKSTEAHLGVNCLFDSFVDWYYNTAARGKRPGNHTVILGLGGNDQGTLETLSTLKREGAVVFGDQGVFGVDVVVCNRNDIRNAIANLRE